jgi:tRNA(Ile)-lysidine synthetase-like protein
MRATPHPCEAALAALPDAPLLAAISGGVDSVALLYALVATGRKPVVLHFDHGWRQASAADAIWVRDLAHSHGLRYVTGKRRPGRKYGMREADARAARYRFFAQVARKLGTPHLVLAHHADDQVETFLLQLLRGSGAAGRGMDPVSTREGLTLHRPWLALWKKDLLAYARKQKLAWRDDSTNADTRHRRNLVRRQVLPYLRKKFGPQVEPNLWRAAEIARAESQWLDALCADAAQAAELAVALHRAAPLAQQRRTILRWLQARGIADISFADVEAVRALLTQREPAKINLSAGKHARRRAGKIFIEV